MTRVELTIGALARRANVTVETIRFYQRRGLVREPARAFGRIRHYDQSDIARVRFIKGAQQLGFTLEEILGLLRLEDGVHCDDARRLGSEKLIAVRHKLAELQRMESALHALVSACHETADRMRCPLIAALRGRTVEDT